MALFRGGLLEIVGRGCSVILVSCYPPQSIGSCSDRVYWKQWGVYRVYKETLTGNTGTLWSVSVVTHYLELPQITGNDGADIE